MPPSVRVEIRTMTYGRENPHRKLLVWFGSSVTSSYLPLMHHGSTVFWIFLLFSVWVRTFQHWCGNLVLRYTNVTIRVPMALPTVHLNCTVAAPTLQYAKASLVPILAPPHSPICFTVFSSKVLDRLCPSASHPPQIFFLNNPSIWNQLSISLSAKVEHSSRPFLCRYVQ